MTLKRAFFKFLTVVVGANVFLYVGYSFHTCYCSGERKEARNVSVNNTISTPPQPKLGTETLTARSAFVDEPAPPGEARVFRWDGTSWKRQVRFCSGNYSFKRATLNTPGGPTIMYVHDDAVDKWVSASISKYGSWDANNVKLAVDRLSARPDSMFLDVGAQLGTFSLSVAKTGRHVVAVDPLLENVLRFCKSVQDGNLTHLVTILYVAVSDSRGVVSFNREAGNVGGTQVKKLSRSGDVNDPNIMETVLLDDVIAFLTSTNVFIKMDVETHEYQALSGAKELLKKFSQPDVLMEWLHHRSNPSAAGQLLNFMREQNYTANNFDGSAPRQLDAGTYGNWPPDILLIKKT